MTNYWPLFAITHITFIVSFIIFCNNKDNVLVMFIGVEMLALAGIAHYALYFSYFYNFGGEALVVILLSLGAAATATRVTPLVTFVKGSLTASCPYNNSCLLGGNSSGCFVVFLVQKNEGVGAIVVGTFLIAFGVFCAVSAVARWVLTPSEEPSEGDSPPVPPTSTEGDEIAQVTELCGEGLDVSTFTEPFLNSEQFFITLRYSSLVTFVITYPYVTMFLIALLLTEFYLFIFVLLKERLSSSWTDTRSYKMLALVKKNPYYWGAFVICHSAAIAGIAVLGIFVFL